jgi:hypothetical protein
MAYESTFICHFPYTGYKLRSGIIESYVRPSGGNGAYYGIKRIASCVYNC